VTASALPAHASPAHGGLVHAELHALGLHEDDVLDFSVNVNPYGPCPEIRRAAAEARIERYPDPTAMAARRRIAAWLDVAPESVLVASGAVDVFWAVARAVLNRGDAVLIAEPAFSEMRAAAQHVGARIVPHRAAPEDDFAFDEARVAALLEDEKPRLAYIATPANPSGRLTPPGILRRLAEQYPATQFVVDTSFMSLSREPDERIVHATSRVLWVRSLTKELSVPGLRVGFAVGPRALIAALHAGRPPWSVSAPAEAVALSATTREVREFVAASARTLLGDRERLERVVRALGLAVHPSESTYALVALGPGRTGRELRQALLERHRILVRDATSFGLPHHVRIAARPAADTERLGAALKQELAR
jgi:histidinol-phosphate/aromatic aminotransferase/cobyric acid decarboxylase-like protein